MTTFLADKNYEEHEFQSIVEALALFTIGEHAPDEEEFFDDFVASTPDSKRTLRTPIPLSFGIDDLSIILTPTIISMSAVAIEFLKPFLYETLVDLAKSARNEIAQKLKVQIRHAVVGAPTPKEILNASQRQALTEIVTQRGIDLGMPPEKSAQIAQTVLASLRLVAVP